MPPPGQHPTPSGQASAEEGERRRLGNRSRYLFDIADGQIVEPKRSSIELPIKVTDVNGFA